MKVRVTDIASGIPFDPNLPGQNPTGGYALIWNATDQLWEANAIGANVAGVSPGFVFSRDGGFNSGTYLRTGAVDNSKSGQFIKGTNIVTSIYATSGTNVTVSSTIQFFKRTGLSTRTNIPGLSVTIGVGNYQNESSVNITIGPDFELGGYCSAGQGLSDVVVILYMIPA